MCSNLFGKKVRKAVEERREPEPTTPTPPPETVVPTVPVAPNAPPPEQTVLSADEADVDIASDGSDAELDPSTGRRRPTRASFMSQSRGGAGLKV